jgi:hypothetical protein
MTSFGATNEVFESGLMPTLRFQGQVYHRVGSILPPSDGQHKFLQIYFMGDDRLEAKQRCDNIPVAHHDTVTELQRMLHEHNAYVHISKTALQRMPSDAYKVFIRADKKPADEHERRFNALETDEVAVFIAGNEFDRRDIALEKEKSQLRRVAETHRSYDALQYPLIFWVEEDAYCFIIPQIDPTTGLPLNCKKVSAMDFYAYRIMVRAGVINHMLECIQLCQQFSVNMYAKSESERLIFVRINQKKRRVDEYIRL